MQFIFLYHISHFYIDNIKVGGIYYEKFKQCIFK